MGISHWLRQKADWKFWESIEESAGIEHLRMYPNHRETAYQAAGWV